MKLNITTLSFILFSSISFAQNSSRNGAWISANGDYRVFVVFVHLENHPNSWETDLSIWPTGQIPTDADLYFDATYSPNQQTGLMTKLMHQSSFGQFRLTGDYYPTLVNIDYNSLIGENDGFFMGKVVEHLNINNPVNIVTQHGLSFATGDFDIWNSKSSYAPGTLGTDNQLDYFMVVTDNGLPSSAIIDNCGEGGHFSPSAPNNQILGRTIDQVFFMAACEGLKSGALLKHEFNHSLFGGNVPYHTATQNAGQGTFMGSIMGYSLMGGWGETSNTCNAWDRNRLGWILPNKQFDISARSESDYSEINTDLTYQTPLNANGTSSTTDEFILRDFMTYGDAIRIEMPFVNSDKADARPQYLWLENRQNLSGMLDQHYESTPGVYSFMQVGMEGFDNFNNIAGTTSGPNNYTYPILCSGKWDFNIVGVLDPNSAFGNDVWYSDENANPFAGNQFQMMPVLDKDNNGIIFRTEEIYIGHYEKRDNLGNIILDGSDQYEYGSLALGTKRDAFVPGTSINISTNPAPVPVLCYESRSSKTANPWPYNQSPYINNDTRTTYLNNIGISILEERPNPQGFGNDIVVKINWNKVAIQNDVRWCGDIVSSSGVHMFFINQNTYLDRSMTPNIPYAEPDGLFSLPTELKLKNGSFTSIKSGSKFYVRDNSKLSIAYGADFSIQNTNPTVWDAPLLVIENDASMEIASSYAVLEGDDSKIEVKGEMTMTPSGLLTLKDESILEVAPSGTLRIYPDNILLQDFESKVIVYGELEILGNEDFDVFGNGRFVFADGSTLVLGNGAKFAVSGSNENDIKVELLDNKVLDFSSNDIDISNCKILFNSNSKLQGDNISVSINNCTFYGANNSGELSFDFLESLNVQNSLFEKLHVGLNLRNFGIQPTIVNCEFLNIQNSGIALNNVSVIDIYNSHFNNTIGSSSFGVGINAINGTTINLRNCNFHNLSSGSILQIFNSPVGTQAPRIENCNFINCGQGVATNYVPALSFDHCKFTNNVNGINCLNSDLVNFYNGIVDLNSVGIWVENVDKLLVSSGAQLNYSNVNLIENNFQGIYGVNSTVFVSNRTTIRNNTIGVELNGLGVDQNMLVVGDLGCVNIINNGTGIKGNDFFLDIDAQIHACNRGDCSDVYPINFEGNSVMFDVCYDGLPITEVLARNNFWGVNNLGIPSGINAFSYSVSYGCSFSLNNIFVNDIDWTQNSTCGKFLFIKDPSTLTRVTKLPTYNEYKSGSYDSNVDVVYDEKEVLLVNDINLELQKSSSETLSWLGNRTIADVFEEGYRYYLSEDYITAHSWMVNISSLSIQTYSDKESKHLIHKARNLVDICLAMNSYSLYLKQEESEIESVAIKSVECILVPNPVVDELLIAVNLEGDLRVEIYDLSGRVISAQLVKNKSTFDFSDYSSGTYIIRVTVVNTGDVFTQKVVKS